jgi:hypothetical protein
MRKALELDRCNGGLSHDKGQTEKRESAREQFHQPFLLLVSPVGRGHHLRERTIRSRKGTLAQIGGLLPSAWRAFTSCRAPGPGVVADVGFPADLDYPADLDPADA